VTWYRSLWYKTLDLWSQFRRWSPRWSMDQRASTRFVVTSLPARRVPPSQLYTQHYCPRGEMENRFRSSNSNCSALAPPPIPSRGISCGCGFPPSPVHECSLAELSSYDRASAQVEPSAPSYSNSAHGYYQCSAHSDCYQHWLSLPNSLCYCL